MTLYGTKVKLNATKLLHFCTISTLLSQRSYQLNAVYPDQYLLDIED
jgi:hypothetical protein